MQIVYKVVMVGDFGVGKTSLVKRYIDNSFSEEYLSTIGVSISKKYTPDATMMLWDIEGHTEFKPIFKQYLLGSKGFVIVADLTREDTLNSIDNHIKLCHSVIKDAPICIALNKADIVQECNNKLPQMIQKLSSSILHVAFTSAKTGKGVEDIFQTLQNSIVKEVHK